MATPSIEQQELEELKDPTASTFDTSEAQITKPVFSANESTRLQRLEELETGTNTGIVNTNTGIKVGGNPSPTNFGLSGGFVFGNNVRLIGGGSGGVGGVGGAGSAGGGSGEYIKPKPIPPVVNQQIIIGTLNADTLNGNDQDNIMTSLGLDDIVIGRNGDDLISGGSGNDSLMGDGGKDIIYGDFSASGNSYLIASGNDTIFGGSGNDQLYGQDGQDIIFGGFGNDYIEGGADNDKISGNNGNDILFGDDIEGNPGISSDDIISGNNGNDKIYGGRGNDSLQGDAGKDLLFGGQGYDSLNGGTGNDVLIGTDTDFSGQLQQGFGFGERDVLIGGKNNDTFVLGLEKANGRDVNGNDTVIFDVVLYNDGNINLNGTQDYALIKDFGFINDRVIRGVDKIQLAGSASQYLLGASPVNSISGTGIFFTQGQFVAELIGIVEEISLSNLSLSDSQQFIFV
ncbi:calcium-binding protein [Nostoc sphaeroides CHAB 2801]|uniref:calcium-binding protein n=1 Tax=Nostoc sphaeroides TaxID=446679 RepID=UPI000E4A2CE8|nr:calcium-binding protein [Nostoc sphaeroides]MCC5631366.1 calcium-binding protein [Nostoc sphaeroides CHAB 2801]